MIKSLFYILLYACFNVAGAAIIKLHLKEIELSNWKEWLNFIFNPMFFIAFSLIILSALAMFKALSTNQFSFVIPIATGLNFILTIAVGYYLFHDRLSLVASLGFLMIIGGILVLSLNHQTHA
jgi:multidrug transporter EmrE-like cation transporter